MSEIYKNEDSMVHMSKRLSDSKIFVMKTTNHFTSSKKDLIKQENKLLQLINSDFVMKAEAIYEWEDKLFIFLEFMDGKELT